MTALQDFGPVAHADSGLGVWAAPAWIVALLGMIVAFSGIAYFVWRTRPRRRSNTSGAPSKGR